jgi:DNA invertase Pin-like site-specific DNA recombinase
LEQEFSTLDAQREVCERYIQSQVGNGWAVLADRYDDGGFTGANLERPAFQKLLEDVNDGRVDVVVVYKGDRLSRSLLDFARVMHHFSKRGVDFVSVTQNFSTADAMGRLTLNMLMSFSEYEREMITERTRDKIAAARRRGKWTGGTVPLGYDVVDKKLVVNEAEAELVREVFDLYQEHRSVLAAVAELNRRSRTTKQHVCVSGRTRGGLAWQKNAVLRVLRNPLYAGYMSHGTTLHAGEHSAIIPGDLYHRTQALLDGASSRTRDHSRNPDYLLRGVIRCACGRALTPASSRKHGKEYRYYRCVTRDSRGGDACRARPLSASAIEDFVLGKIRSVAGQDSPFVRALEFRAQRFRSMVPTLVAERDALRSPARCSSRSLASGPSPLDAEAAARLADLDEQIARLGQSASDTETLVRTLRDFEAAWGLLTPQNRGRLVRSLVGCVLVDDGSGTVTVEFVDPAAQLVPADVPPQHPANQGEVSL